ncbi:Dolichyl pyrophosphate Man9GlcNAc2 alpha-1,3-glucosyltransferase-like isoform X1 [Oopsacas minuta]|uniref:Alpha-1,3-glucosyltransferase n=1 Tax=Oopsacas minuta TaxID=111878 RepID=A0AAV7JM14_9METZ|nr:Dolichyl pyrophosphate Man9GlcNAc2 alpha-1,3-glucosyltransferase-like isoform X1 [Oopsacas minuta]
MHTFPVIIFAVLVRWCLSLWKYSGEAIPPMFGDFEAQRHWMEICYHLPPSQWYANSTSNNLLYWGLDYPPLTGYHSYVCGAVAQLIDSQFIALNTSHGFESYNLKLFMRATVLTSDILIYFSSTFLYVRTLLSRHPTTQRSLFFALLLLPSAILLIDYCHFQFNTVSLGLALLAYTMLANSYDVIGCIFFSLSLNYKQMEIYHALPFFCYLLGRAFKTRYEYIVFYAISVIVTFVVIWYPFLDTTSSAVQVLKRIFPIERGLFEDKVASVWCVLDIIIKIRVLFSQKYLVYVCFVSTIIALLPSCIHLIRKPTIHNLMLSLANSSLTFFLFSFHVHEKSILLAVLPATFLLPFYPYVMNWFIAIASFSLFPLLQREGNIIPALSMTIMFYHIANEFLFKTSVISLPMKHTHILSMIGCMILSVLPLVQQPPTHLPDLWAVLNAGYCCVHFCGFLYYFHYLQFTSHRKKFIDTKGALILKPIKTE